MPNSLEQLTSDINARLQAIGESVSEARIKQIVGEHLNSALNDEAFVRKMRFSASDKNLLGSKYYRWGLNLQDIEWLFDLQTALAGTPKRGGGVHAGPSETLRNTFEALSGAYYLPMEQVREMDRRAIDDEFSRIPLSWLKPEDQALAKRGAWQETSAYRAAVRAMDTAESGFGQQLVGAQYVGDLWDAARPQSLLFGLIDTFEMSAPTAYLPVEVDIPELLYVSESTANNSSNYATVKTGSQRVSVSAAKFVIHQMWSGEMEEDSIIPFVPFIRGQQAKSIAHYSDSLVLNGDNTNAGTGNINLDDADPADTKHYLAFDGIRHAGLVDNTNNRLDLAGAITYAALRNARTRMKDTSNVVHWGQPTDPNDLVYVADWDTVEKINQLDEVLTVDNYGTGATVLTGEVAKIGRNPLIGSMAMSLTEADGKVSTTGSNNVKGQVVTFNRRAFKVGWRRRIRTEVERLPGTDQTRIVASMRMGFGRFTPTGAASGIEAADVIYDISL